MKIHRASLSGQFFALPAILTLCLLCCLSAQATTEEHLTKNFTVKPGGTIVVDVDMGSIDVATDSGTEVAVDVLRKIGRSKKADEEAFLKDHPVEFTQDGDKVTVRCRTKSKISRSWKITGKNENDVKYTITVPAKFNARLNTAGGGISVTDLSGEVKADTSAGGLKFTRVHGPLTGDTSGGGIHLVDCEGKIKIQTSAGGITLTGGSGSLDAETSGGSVTVKQFQGPANVHTSAGGITLENVAGAIHGGTSGGGIKAALPAPLKGDVKLETSAGGITIELPSTAAFELDAETSAGSVHSDLPVTAAGKRKNDRLKGSVNGGGPSMLLRSSAGSIHLKSART